MFEHPLIASLDLAMHICCPACQHDYDEDDALRGANVRCPTCNVLFMAIPVVPVVHWRIPCPACRKVHTIASDLESSLVECDVCHSEFEVAPCPVLDGWGLQPGDVLDELYTILNSHLGPTGLVHRARHSRWECDIAIHEPSPHYFTTAEQTACYARELEACLSLPQHPHIVSCYDLRPINYSPWLFTEWVESGSLAEWLITGHLYQRPRSEILHLIMRWSVQAASALAFAHSHGLIHGHLGPHKILITDDLTVKLNDFGAYPARHSIDLSRIDDDEAGHQQVPGTSLLYCSPEQFNYHIVGPPTDVWTWALIVLELFQGEPTWSIGATGDQALQHHRERHGSNHVHASGSHADIDLEIPGALLDLLAACLVADPRQRPQDMTSVHAKLLTIYADCFGTPYEQLQLDHSLLSANALNNQAVALLDTGAIDEADDLFRHALDTCANHPEATYNRGVMLWRKGHVTDSELIGQLQAVATDPLLADRAHYLISLVHLERGDDTSATDILTALTSGRIADRRLRESLYRAQELTAVGRANRQTLEGHRDHITCFAVAANGRFIASGSRDKTVVLWDLAKSASLRQFAGHREAVTCIAIADDGHLILSGSGNWQPPPPPPPEGQSGPIPDSTFRIWNMDAAAPTNHHFDGISWTVGSVDFSPHGRFALIQTMDHRLRLADIPSGAIAMEANTYCAQGFPALLLPDGQSFLAYRREADNTPGVLARWNCQDGACLQRFSAEGFTGGPFTFCLEGRRCH